MDNETNDGGVSLYKFNEDQFYKMSEVGILPWDGTEELLAGVGPVPTGEKPLPPVAQRR